MRSLRKLWRFALAATAWALVMGCWLLPGRAEATVPQAPNQQSVLTISASGNGNTLNISGRLTAGGQPISGAVIIVTLDTQDLGHVPTGADGSYSTSTPLPNSGTHVVTATFGGDTTTHPASATQRFAVAPPAPATTAAPTTVITAQLSPNPVAAGSVLAVSGTLASAGVPIDSARVDITCDFGGTSALGVTDAGGAFTANLGLPATGQPAKLTVTVSYTGDNRFAAARGTFQASVTAAATPTVATPSIPPAPTGASVAPASSTPTSVQSSAALTLRNATTPAATVGVVLGIVGVGAFIALGVLWMLAWSRHDLLPGERRGFGSDFGRRRRSA
ncbi:MAG TPA: Ig-like domain-containing protein [Propionibacteriaceae bacterium]